VNLLVIPASYPYPGAEWAGINNEHSAVALRLLVQHLEVLSPRPYAPRLLAFNDRWRGYAAAPKRHIQKGILVHRPAYPQVPRILQAFWPTTAAFVFSRRLAMKLHRRVGFDAILSFDLAGAGGLAWRLGRTLAIPACGWATGSDMRWHGRSPIGRSVRTSLDNLDLVFYQSAELKALGAELLGTSSDNLSQRRHIVQARGVAEPDAIPGEEARRAIRSELGLSDNRIVVLYVGRIVRQKGLFDLLDVFGSCMKAHQNLVLLLVGSRPGYDETAELQARIDANSALSERVRILPGCASSKVWDYFSAADIFAFPSFKEGMPNSLLEAMLGSLPAVAFGIPSVKEISRFGKAPIEVPPYDFEAFAEALLMLAEDAALRREVGECGRAIAREHFSIDRSMRSVVHRIEGLATD